MLQQAATPAAPGNSLHLQYETNCSGWCVKTFSLCKTPPSAVFLSLLFLPCLLVSVSLGPLPSDLLFEGWPAKSYSDPEEMKLSEQCRASLCRDRLSCTPTLNNLTSSLYVKCSSIILCIYCKVTEWMLCWLVDEALIFSSNLHSSSSELNSAKLTQSDHVITH